MTYLPDTLEAMTSEDHTGEVVSEYLTLFAFDTCA